MNENLSPVDDKPTDVPGKLNWIRILLVILLAIILAGILLPRFRGGVPARFVAASTQIAVLGTALGAFNSDNGHFPRDTNGLMDLIQKPPDATNWRGPYIEHAVPSDPWGHAYIYICPGQHNPQSYDLSSKAPDGQVICNWKQE